MTVYRDKKSGLYRYDFRMAGVRYTDRGYPTQAKAKAAEAEAKKRLLVGLTGTWPTFSDLLADWLEHLASRGVNRHTMAQSVSQFNKWLAPLATRQPSAITALEVQRLLAHCARQTSPVNANAVRKQLRACFSYAVRLGGLDRNPAALARGAGGGEVMDGHSTDLHTAGIVVALYPGGSRPRGRVATGAPVIHCKVCWILLPDDSTGACVPAPDDAEQSWEYGNATCVARRGERWERLGGRTKPGAHVKRLSPDVLARREAIRARVAQLTAEGYSVRRMVRALRDEGYRLLHGSPSHEMVERMRREVRR